MSGGSLYLVAVVLWVIGSIAWGVYFAWDTSDILHLALLGGLFLPFTLFVLVGFGIGNALYLSVHRLNTTVQRRRAAREAITHEIEEWLRQ